MVFYIARCKTKEEAKDVRDQLVASCPSLIYARILGKESDLDAYDADLLRSADEDTALGAFTFSGPEPAPLRKVRRWLRQGRPVVIGASEELPVESARLSSRLDAYF